MFNILDNENIAPDIFKMIIEAPLVASRAMPGQFVMIRIDETGERIPLTIADREDKNITIVYQAVGVTTHRLTEKKKGEAIADVAGPMGYATEIKNIGAICCIGGGVGIAELYPVVKAYKEAGNHLIVIIGARNKELLIYKDELKALSKEIFINTDDGSFGEKGFVTDSLRLLLKTTIKIDLVYAVGPGVMMEAVSNLTRPYGIKTTVSLNTVLLDGTGMCGSCRVEIGKETKFVCVDGPEFDGHLVNFKELKARQGLFKEQERHACKIRGITK